MNGVVVFHPKHAFSNKFKTNQFKKSQKWCCWHWQPHSHTIWHCPARVGSDYIFNLFMFQTRNWITGSFVCHQLPRQNLSLCSISNIKLHVTWYLWSCRKKIETDNNWSWIVKNEHYSCLNLVTLMDRGDNWALIDYLYSELSLIFVPVKEMTTRRKMMTVLMMLIGMRWVKVEMTLVLLLLMTFLFIVS